MLKSFVKLFGGDPNRKTIEQYSGIANEINSLEAQFEALSDDALRAKTDEFKERIAQSLGDVDGLTEREQFEAGQDALEDILPEAFATVREASKRTIGLRHYDVQLIGGVALHRGSIAEMRTGEGKTLVATLPIYLNALLGKGVHLITVNDYLARRDARWMAPIYSMLGLSVGVLQMAAATENGKKAFLVDLERESPHEDQHQLQIVDRRLAYEADITYGTNSEFGFDYLRDNMTMRLSDRVQRGHYFAIVDEVDNVLIDEARTPLIISGPASGNLEWYGKMAQVVRQLKPDDYEINEKDRNAPLTESGLAHVEQLLGQTLTDPDRPEDISPEQVRLLGYLEQAMRAQFLFHRNKEYLVQGGKVVIVDENTGRQMPGRRWSDGLHQAVEAKEGLKIEPENVTYATVTLQNYFRMYEKLGGMTGTALTEAEEFSKIYELEVAPIPPNLEYQAFGKDAPLIEIKAKDEDGYSYSYFSKRDDTQEEPLFFRRKDYPDVIYKTLEAKLRAIVMETIREHVRGRPLLVGTTSVESSERLSSRLKAESVRRLMQIALVREAWLQANNREQGEFAIPELQFLNDPIEKITPDALRKFIQPLGVTNINPEDQSNINTLLGTLRLDSSDTNRLKSVLQAGIPHQVLNARKHTEESQVIAGAGAFGAVTIATNMAGRGVDIKLGGEIAEEVISAANRVLRKAGYENPFDMSLEERRVALQNVDTSSFGIYEAEVKHFLQYFEDMERVKKLGGLHVIGTERHDARRIDNQLRGRAARQGDPGASRFYLSLQDDLMRIQGGQQVSSLMERMKVDDAFPLEVKLVSNLIEQSQHRVEGANFDVRKHLLEYDDVLNKQRTQIYEQRDRIFTKEELRDDVQEMLEAEVRKRVEAAFADNEGPWKLLAWLDQVQPPFPVGETGLFPSYTLKLILTDFASKPDPKVAAADLARHALEIEHGHTQRAIESAVTRSSEALDTQIAEREDLLDTFISGLRDSEEPRKPQQILEELQSLLRIPVKLDNNQMRALTSDPASLKDDIGEMISDQLVDISMSRLVGAVENRLGESLGISKENVADSSWDDLAALVAERSRSVLARQQERLVGSGGQIARDAEALMQREPLTSDAARLRLLLSLSQGVRNAFDAKTHRPVKQVYQRFGYSFLAAEIVEKKSAEDVTEEILVHLEEAEDALAIAWGRDDLQRRSEPAEGQDEAQAREGGLRLLNEAQRRLLLSAITELWVDYLTRIEALRVSIGLEAYAQRDPLVQYKSRASEMFQTLLEDIRAVVIGRLFATQRRPTVAVLEDAAQEEAPAASSNSPAMGGKKKRKRH